MKQCGTCLHCEMSLAFSKSCIDFEDDNDGIVAPKHSGRAKIQKSLIYGSQTLTYGFLAEKRRKLKSFRILC